MRRASSIATALSLAACVPELDEANTRVEAPRVLAVRAEPAEIAPRAQATFRALYADSSGNLSEGDLDWAYCLTRKSLAELGPISPDCLVEAGDSLEPIGEGLEAAGKIPPDACRAFGPDRPMRMDDEPAGRPVDADPTGGYYQPLRLFDREEQAYTIFDARIRCGLPGVTMAQFAEFNRRYAINTNPAIEALVAGEDDVLEPGADGAGFAVEPGAELALTVWWPSCDELPACDGDECVKPEPCGGSEPYVYFDPEARAVVTRREGLRVSWFATAGSFRDGRTGRGEQDANQGDSENVWTAPEEDGDVVLWVVLRDDRGGTSWQSYRVRVGG